jgi:hypothetical protein
LIDALQWLYKVSPLLVLFAQHTRVILLLVLCNFFITKRKYLDIFFETKYLDILIASRSVPLLSDNMTSLKFGTSAQ